MTEKPALATGDGVATGFYAAGNTTNPVNVSGHSTLDYLPPDEDPVDRRSSHSTTSAR